jgi:hypothetical protein
MANETELGNLVHQTDIVAGIMTEAFVTADTVFPLMLTQTFPDTTNVIKFAKSGSLTASTGSESTAHSFGAGDELTDTSTTVTGTRKQQAVKITLEAARFGGPFNSLQRAVQEGGRSLARLAASEFKTKFASVANEVIATSTLTKDDILDGRFNVVSSTKGAGSAKLVGMFDYKGMNELAKELYAVSADAFTSQVDLGVLGISQAGTPKGELFDVVLYETDGLPTNTGDDEALIWDPALAFCAGVDGINGFEISVKDPESQSPWFEIFLHTFWNIAEHNDTAACRVRSDS